jgi:hypothetical protein
LTALADEHLVAFRAVCITVFAASTAVFCIILDIKAAVAAFLHSGFALVIAFAFDTGLVIRACVAAFAAVLRIRVIVGARSPAKLLAGRTLDLAVSIHTDLAAGAGIAASTAIELVCLEIMAFPIGFAERQAVLAFRLFFGFGDTFLVFACLGVVVAIAVHVAFRLFGLWCGAFLYACAVFAFLCVWVAGVRSAGNPV